MNNLWITFIFAAVIAIFFFIIFFYLPKKWNQNNESQDEDNITEEILNEMASRIWEKKMANNEDKNQLSSNALIQENNEVEEAKDEQIKSRLTLKVLTQEQIDEIHSRGNLTPSEMYQVWLDMGLCPTGDAMEGAAWRCKKFGNCDDCLIDLANEVDEHTPYVFVASSLDLVQNLDDLIVPAKE